MHQNNPILINNRKLNYEHTFRYLGIDIDQNLSMKTTCDSIYRNASHKPYIQIGQRLNDHVGRHASLERLF